MKGTSLSRLAISGDLLARALVAQWIEQRTSNPSVAGSNPAGRAVYRLASPPRLSVPSDSFHLRAQRGHISTGSRAAPNQRWGGMGGASPQSVIDGTAASFDEAPGATSTRSVIRGGMTLVGQRADRGR